MSMCLYTVGHPFVSPYHVNNNFTNVNTTPTFARAGDHKLTVMVSGRHSFAQSRSCSCSRRARRIVPTARPGGRGAFDVRGATMGRSQAGSIAARPGAGRLSLLREKCRASSNHISKSTSLRTAALRVVLAALSSKLYSILRAHRECCGFAHGGRAVRTASPRKEPTSNHPAI